MRYVPAFDRQGYGCAAVICTAVEIETECLLETLGGWEALNVSGDRQRYRAAHFEDRHGVGRTVVTCQQDMMGMAAASALATKAIYTFRPRYLIMCGIAAGIGEGVEQMYGDVLVPDVVWDYSTGKYVGPNESEIRYGDVGFLPRPQSLHLDPKLHTLIERLSQPGACEFHLELGPLACGTSVVANRSAVDTRIKALFPTTTGLDMESYAIFLAAEKASAPKPKALVLKSICDYADNEKSDQYQRFAAFTSTRFAEYLLQEELDFE